MGYNLSAINTETRYGHRQRCRFTHNALGQSLWMFALPEGAMTAPAVNGKGVYFGATWQAPPVPQPEPEPGPGGDDGGGDSLPEPGEGEIQSLKARRRDHRTSYSVRRWLKMGIQRRGHDPWPAYCRRFGNIFFVRLMVKSMR